MTRRVTGSTKKEKCCLALNSIPESYGYTRGDGWEV